MAAKTRYRQSDAPCTVVAAGDALRLSFAEPQWAVTPGQSAVLYDGDVCLGGDYPVRREGCRQIGRHLNATRRFTPGVKRRAMQTAV
jgi:hypothetical protein